MSANGHGFDRRRFLQRSLRLGGAAVAGSLTGGLWLPSSALAQDITAETTRTLVVVDLQGGNDALNTLVPATGRYHDLRPSIALHDEDLLTFAGLELGVHPALSSLEPLWDAGQIAALYGTGLDGQGRSHFVAQDAWRTAQPGEPARSGWLGRWLEASAPPGGAAEATALRAVALGQSTLAAQGAEGRPVAIQSVDGFRLQPPDGNDAVVEAMLAMSAGSDDSVGSDLFSDVQQAIPRSVAAVDELQALVAGVELDEGDEIDLDGDGSLFLAAQAIIQGDVGTEVIYITINGFDTHALQLAKHDALLRLVADGLSGLFTGLAETGHDTSTLAMVVSEFGRRVADNGSGTDHGKGGLSLLLGPAVRSSGLIGEPDLDDLDNGDLPITIDARSMYDSALRWLGATDETIVSVLGDRYDTLDLVGI